MNTRRDYLEGRCSHREYYLEIAKEIGPTCVAEILARVKRSKDQHLNDIPLSDWDALAGWIVFVHGDYLRSSLRKRGDFITDAGMVSLLKVFYLDAATKG